MTVTEAYKRLKATGASEDQIKAYLVRTFGEKAKEELYPAPKPVEVTVVNHSKPVEFPEVQKVTVENQIELPETQKVEVTNFPEHPALQKVEVVNKDKAVDVQKVEVTNHQDITFPDKQTVVVENQLVLDDVIKLLKLIAAKEGEDISKLLEPLQYLSNDPTKPISVRLSDGEGFYKWMSSVVRATLGSLQDNTLFTPGSSRIVGFGAEVDDTSTTAVTENNVGALRMSTRRELYVQIRDAAGNERGLNIDASGNITTTSSESQASTATSTAVTVAATSTTVLAANSSRKEAIIVNDSDETIYLKYGSGAALNSGIRLNANGGMIVETKYTGIITAISTSGSKVVTVTEV